MRTNDLIMGLEEGFVVGLTVHFEIACYDCGLSGITENFSDDWVVLETVENGERFNAVFCKDKCAPNHLV